MKFAVEAGVLRFGEFRTKAGRLSPYFFNSALFDDGAKLILETQQHLGNDWVRAVAISPPDVIRRGIDAADLGQGQRRPFRPDTLGPLTHSAVEPVPPVRHV